jgi:amino-acid N-acetyltransferase
MSETVISLLSVADVPVVLELLKQSGLPEVGIAENVSAFAVARSDGILVGCIGLEVYGGSGLLRSLVVRPNQRSRGLGAALVQYALARAEQWELLSVYLLTTTAREYFTRFGFSACPRDGVPDGIASSWEFRTGCPNTAVLMVRAVRS